MPLTVISSTNGVGKEYVGAIAGIPVLAAVPPRDKKYWSNHSCCVALPTSIVCAGIVVVVLK